MASKGRLLLTGGNGMVGRNIREHPLAGYWDILAPSHAELDLGNASALAGWMEKNRPDAVIHAAGRVGGIQANIAEPVEFLIQNLDIARNVILASRKAGISRLINLASSCMYPHAAPNPLKEELILHGELEPTNEGYALAKIISTRLCQYIRREQPDLHYKTLIPCNLYGKYDNFSPERSHLIPAIIHKVHQAKVSGASSVEIWGDGTARREFMYATDMADASLHALDDIEHLPDLMNIGMGSDYSINEYYGAVANAVGWSGEFTHNLNRPVGMKQKLVSIERQRLWGWSAATNLNEGIRQAYAFYLDVIQK